MLGSEIIEAESDEEDDEVNNAPISNENVYLHNNNISFLLILCSTGKISILTQNKQKIIRLCLT
jgi:hypothetical protein